jgi:flavoprotein
VYKRLFSILWFGNHVGNGSDGKVPTYVFPVEIRSTVGERFQEQNASGCDEQFEKKSGVYHVTMEELLRAKWPAPPKTCGQCKHKKGKPY